MGLFVHNRWSEFVRGRWPAPGVFFKRLLELAGIFLTFNYVALGWVFFALPSPAISWQVFLKLWGAA